MSRAQKTFWQRHEPLKAQDIALLRPPTLERGKRFETLADTHSESVRSEQVLAAAGEGLLAETLNDCRSGAYACEKPYCPVCARTFRRWFVGQMLDRLRGAKRAHVVTVLLETAKRGELDQLTLNRQKALLRKRLRQSGINVPVIGCFEVAYKARQQCWVLHINLLTIGATKQNLKLFQSKWKASALARPVETLRVKHPAKQISYVPKFTTYHRPGIQSGPTRSRAMPLNNREHGELVSWMAPHRFDDFMFLHNCRRNGSEIVEGGTKR